VFVNGRFAPALSRFTSLPRGLVIKPLAEAIATEQAMHLALARYADTAQRFVALNTALFADGIYIRAGDGVVDEIPIHVLHVSTGAGVVAPRSLILAAENSQVSVVESYVGLGTGARLVVPVSEIVAKGGAKVRHVKLLREHHDTTHLGWNQLHLERDAEVSAHVVSLSGGLARNDVHAVLSAEGANCTLNGLVLGNGSSHIDNHVLVDHVRPHGTSSQLYRSVVDDKSRSVFSGKVIVRPGANGTNAQQTNNNLLLSNDAKVDTKPQLEIYTDDVKCSHGATSGQLNPESVFFLRARGLNEPQARALLTYAFVREVIEQVKIEPARAALDKLISERFAGLLAS
jgi:Fe-S cluster assembly protein SufD